MSSQLYTSSRLKVLRQCLRLHFYRYVLGIQTPSSPVADFGTVAHSALEAWLRAWQRGELDARLPAAIAAIRTSALSEYDQARLLALITAYHLRWHAEPWEILAVEVEFRYQLGGDLIGGKIDAIIWDTRDGRVWVLEHKTTGQDASPGSTYWQRLSLDSQVSIYIDGATVMGHEVAGVIYDVLQRPKHEPLLATPVEKREYTIGKGCKACGGSAKAGEVQQGRGYYEAKFADRTERTDCPDCKGTGWKCDKDGNPQAPKLYAKQRAVDETVDEFTDRLAEEIGAAPDDFLIRGIVVRLEHELPQMRLDLADEIALEKHCASREAWPRNPDACARFGTTCSFFPVCAGQASIDDQQRYPRGTAHPELQNAA